MSYTQFSKEELNRENLINDVDFIYDAKQFLYDREDYQSDNAEDIYDRYLEHFRYQNVNEVSAVRDMYLAQEYEQQGDDEGLARMGRLMSTFEKQNGEYNLETVTDYLGGIITAPSTIGSMFSFGATKAGAVAAQQAKQFKGIDHLEKRLLNAQKRVLKDEVERLVLIHEQLFPNDNLQERTLNFTSFFLELGSDFIPQLIDSLDPLNPNFVLLEY